MQVRCLREALPAGVEVGTVDKFQGREAPVVFFSMASSSGEDVPRGLEFLFSRNRFNVAISRAKALAVVVCSPRLLETRCRTVEQMRLVNALCRFAEHAASVHRGREGQKIFTRDNGDQEIPLELTPAFRPALTLLAPWSETDT